MLVTGTDLDGAPVEIEVDGWRARIMQHEFDHLDGMLYVDRLGDGDWKTVQKIARKRGWGASGRLVDPGRRRHRAPDGRARRAREQKRTTPEWSPGPSAPRLGLEPRTYRLTADCSAN